MERKFAFAAAAILMGIGALVLLGWALDLEVLKTFSPNGLSMKANAALGLFLAGASLGLNAKKGGVSAVPKGLAILVMLLGFMTLLEYLGRWDLRIDQLLFREPLGATATMIPGRMAPRTAVALFLSGIGLLLLDQKGQRGKVADLLFMVVGSLACIATTGYLYGAGPLLGPLGYTPIALNTSLAFVALAAGGLVLRMDQNWLAILKSTGPGGKLVRRAFPVVVALPVLMLWLEGFGENAGVFDDKFGNALSVVILVALLSTGLFLSARAVDRSGKEAAEAAAMARVSAEIEDLYNRAPCGYHSLDPDGTIIRMNETELGWLGYAREEVIGKATYKMMIPPEGAPIFDANFPSLKQNGFLRDLKIPLRRKDGSVFPALVNASSIVGPDGSFVMSRSIVQNMTELQKAEDELRLNRDQLQSLSFLDGLTGIPNRRRFDEFLDREWRRGIRSANSISLLMMDIDFFKDFNDHFGHTAGDDCLRRVAHVLDEIIARPGDLLARYGGEEFAAILSDTKAGGALRVAQRMQENLARKAIPHASSAVAPVVTLSIGIATLVPKKEEHQLDLVEAADRALYRAKEAGRNRIQIAE